MLLIAVGTLRLAGVVLSQPMLGYANQYDMARMSACVAAFRSYDADGFFFFGSMPLSRRTSRAID